MHTAKKAIAVMVVLLSALITLPNAIAQAADKIKEREEDFDLTEFVKRFKIGMSYSEVQEALPKKFQQDILSYITTDEVFVLNIDIPSAASWSASFKFDTLDSPMRRPEQLIEISCSASLSSRAETFESLVKTLAAVFGEPIRLDDPREQIRQAGWRVSGGSVLTLEYSLVPAGANRNDVRVDLVVRKKPRHATSTTKAVA